MSRRPPRPDPHSRGGDRRGDPRPVAESLDVVARALGGPDAAGIEALFSRWSDLVGPEIGAHSWPMSLAGAVLVVAVDHPAWSTELAFREADLKAGLARLGGMRVDRVELRVRRR